MNYQKVNLATWHRKAYFEHFTKAVCCTYSMTVNLDISSLQNKEIYPQMLFFLTKTVNQFEEFRTQWLHDDVVIFDEMMPAYTILNPENHNFVSIYTEWNRDYQKFLAHHKCNVEKYQNAQTIKPQVNQAINVFDVSMMPWESFSAFNLNIHGNGRHLLPIFTMGKTWQQHGKTCMPLAVQVHHAVCDGFHVHQFLSALRQNMKSGLTSFID